MREFLDRLMNAAPRGPVDVLVVIVIVAFIACVVTLTVRKMRDS